MILQMYSVRDKAVEAFLRPLFMRSKGEALRSFLDAVKSNDDFRAHPEDFDFYFLGEFDDGAGLFKIPDSPVLLITGLQAMSKPE